MTETRIPFNLNNCALVKLTPNGRKIWLDYWRPYSGGKEEQMLDDATDAEGYFREQLWAIMQVFGPHIRMGCNPPFETEILLIPSSDRQSPAQGDAEP